MVMTESTLNKQFIDCNEREMTMIVDSSHLYKVALQAW